MNILITNAVPLNGGDEALLRATVESLQARWPRSNVTTLCKNVELTRRQLPDLSFASDLEFATDIAELQQVAELYRTADVVLSAAGGIFHDHYPIEDRLRGFEFALDLGRPVVLFAQSVGPFWKPASLKRVPEVFNRLSAICVRDAQSRTYLLDCGVAAEKIRPTADAAFLWHRLAPELFRPKSSPVRTIGLCFRVWPIEDTSRVKETIVRAQELCRHLLTAPGRKLVFISTCQGIAGYVDDSELALQITGGLPTELKSRCEIDRARHAPREFMKKLSACDAFIGMRLHGCIQAMLAGTPAMGLGYEHKTAEIFQQLGLGDFQVRFDGKIADWLACAEKFLARLPEIRNGLPAALDRICRQSELNLEVLDEVRKAGPAETSFEQKSAAQARAYQFLDKLYERIQWHQRIPQAVEDIATVVPQGENVVVVDEDVLDRVLFNRWRPVPFVEKDGVYFGPPADDATAISEFERLRSAGANFAVIAWPAFWWLEHYHNFAAHLESSYARLLETERVVIFDLRKRGIKNGAAPARKVSVDSRPDVFQVIERIHSEKLTYLNLSALADLWAAVRHIEEEGVPGIFIETGCALGGSALVIGTAKKPTRRLFVYDVFGMIPPPSPAEAPEVHERYRIIKSGESSGLGGKSYYGYEDDLVGKVTGSFVRFGLPLFPNAISLVKGLYEETLCISDPVAFAHIDCDWYDSVLTCLQRIEPRLSNGGILVIDDYFVWSGCRRAVDEYFASRMPDYEFQTKSRLHIVRRQRHATGAGKVAANE